jgi:uncharacterized protein YdiU (UPF0061 family)
VERATAVIQAYPEQYEAEWLAVMRKKLGLAQEEEGDRELAETFLEAQKAGRADFTQAFRGLSEAVEDDAPALLGLFENSEALRAWLPRWRQRLTQEEADAAARDQPALYPPQPKGGGGAGRRRRGRPRALRDTGRAAGKPLRGPARL